MGKPSIESVFWCIHQKENLQIQLLCTFCKSHDLIFVFLKELCKEGKTIKLMVRDQMYSFTSENSALDIDMMRTLENFV